MVLDKQMSSMKYIQFVQKQMPLESVDEIVINAIKNLDKLVNFYIPKEKVMESKAILFETLINSLE
jgi:hypothetical protein